MSRTDGRASHIASDASRDRHIYHTYLLAWLITSIGLLPTLYVYSPLGAAAERSTLIRLLCGFESVAASYSTGAHTLTDVAQTKE